MGLQPMVYDMNFLFMPPLVICQFATTLHNQPVVRRCGESIGIKLSNRVLL